MHIDDYRLGAAGALIGAGMIVYLQRTAQPHTKRYKGTALTQRQQSGKGPDRHRYDKQSLALSRIAADKEIDYESKSDGARTGAA